MSEFGYDINGIFKRLPDGRVLRIQRRLYNTLLTLCSSQEDKGWSYGW